MANNRTKTVRLYKQSPHCHWCGIETVLAQKGETRLENNTATFDHLYTVLEEERYLENNLTLGVLACRKCNTERGYRSKLEHTERQEKNQLTIRQNFELTYYGKVLT